MERAWVRWGVVALVVAAAVAFLVGGWRSFVSVSPNYCAMTYMTPSYLPWPVPNSPHGKYNLVLYREGHQSSLLEGQPVLFIPGNGGSASQVRSLGAVTRRLALATGRKGVDWFAAHFNEELSAFDGDLLTDQVDHVVHCIDVILQSYQAPNRSDGSHPSSVLIVGHSMGGFVARALFLHPAFRPSTVDTLLTLNTPHTSMPLLLQRSVADLYHRVNGFWRQQFNMSQPRHHRGDHFPVTPSLANVTVVSLAGSFRDTLVRSDLANLETLVPISHGLSLLTTSVPGVRLEADHQSIMWCNQLVKAVSSAMLELADLHTNQRVVPVDQRMHLFGRHFLSPLPYRLGFSLPYERWYSQPYLRSIPRPKASFTSNDIYPHSTLRQRADEGVHTFNISHWRDRSFVLIAPRKVADLQVVLYPTNQGPAILAANLSFVAHQYGDDDVYVQGKSRMMSASSSAEGLSILYLAQEQLRDYDFLAISPSSAVSNASQVLFGQFLVPETTITLNLPHYGFIAKRDVPRGHSALINVTVPSSDQRLPLLLTLKATNGSADWTPIMYALMPHMSEEIMTTTDLSRVPIKFHGTTEPQPLHLVFFIDPECGYELEVEYDYAGIMQQMLTYHLISAIPAYFFVYLFVLAALAQRYSTGESMAVGVAWRDQTFRLSCVLFVGLPLFETVWVLTTGDDHLQLLYSFVGDALARLPGPLGEHSFVDFDVSPPPLSFYPFLFAFGTLLFLLYFVLVRIALFVLSTFFLAISWLVGALLGRRQPPQDAPATEQEERKGKDKKMPNMQKEAELESARQQRRLSVLGVVYLLLLAVSAGLTLVAHSFVGLLGATLVLGVSTAWQTARAKRTAGPVAGEGAYEREALFSYQTMILVACIATLCAMAPLFVSWVRSLPLAWGTGDGYELLSLILIVVTAFANHPFQRGYVASLLWVVAYVAAGVVVGYCLVPVYRLQDVALVYSLLVFLHLQKER